ncbi:MAG TPA: DUF255 domain-containing protein [Opitutaceae bacterium]|jgi:hypothetical protein|nr:DUF255 domain-containing protein [Opitutaceae bacterium]
MLNKTVLSLVLVGFLASAASSRAADRLKDEKSAFVRTFVSSPVDWMPWGDAAFARAKAEQRPVFVFVGAFTNELSGAMRKQSFANLKNAEWLNKKFVCVVVDKDEHPDVAALYQTYVSNLKQLNGWPLNIWLTPEFQPFEGATYLSPSEDWGAPGFLKLANQANTAWETDASACRRRAQESASQLAPPAQPPRPPVWNLEKTRTRLTAAAAAWGATFDPTLGGFGDLPKSPEPELIRFMLLQSPGDRESARKTLRAIAASAIRDPLDGGFFRHAADGAWKIPYQQKTLLDQARMALAYLDAANGPDGKSFAQCARGAIDYALSRLANPDGTFAAAEDATGEEFTGYYAWTESDIDQALGADSAKFKSDHGVMLDGNVDAADDPSATYAKKNLLRSIGLTDPAQADLEARLLEVRNKRPAPPRDLRATAAAHGMLLTVLARAGKQLREPRYSEAATKLLEVIKTSILISPEGNLRHLAGSDVAGTAEDYASMALACREYDKTMKDPESLRLANKFLVQLATRYYDSSTASYFGAPAVSGAAFFIRPPAGDEPPTAASMALPARAIHATAVAAQLSESLEETSAQAPGDELLALAFFAGEGPVR